MPTCIYKLVYLNVLVNITNVFTSHLRKKIFTLNEIFPQPMKGVPKDFHAGRIYTWCSKGSQQLY